MEVQEKDLKMEPKPKLQVNTIQGNRCSDRRKHEMLTEHLGITKPQSDFKAKWPTYIQGEREETLKKPQAIQYVWSQVWQGDKVAAENERVKSGKA